MGFWGFGVLGLELGIGTWDLGLDLGMGLGSGLGDGIGIGLGLDWNGIGT